MSLGLATHNDLIILPERTNICKRIDEDIEGTMAAYSNPDVIVFGALVFLHEPEGLIQILPGQDKGWHTPCGPLRDHRGFDGRWF
jgi:hypothetical protein